MIQAMKRDQIRVHQRVGMRRLVDVSDQLSRDAEQSMLLLLLLLLILLAAAHDLSRRSTATDQLGKRVRDVRVGQYAFSKQYQQVAHDERVADALLHHGPKLLDADLRLQFGDCMAWVGEAFHILIEVVQEAG
jgi:hypothetical protein